MESILQHTSIYIFVVSIYVNAYILNIYNDYIKYSMNYDKVLMRHNYKVLAVSCDIFRRSNDRGDIFIILSQMHLMMAVT